MLIKFLPSQMGSLDVLVLLDTRLTRRHWLPKDGLIKLEPFSAALLYGLMDPVDGAVSHTPLTPHFPFT